MNSGSSKFREVGGHELHRSQTQGCTLCRLHSAGTSQVPGDPHCVHPSPCSSASFYCCHHHVGNFPSHCCHARRMNLPCHTSNVLPLMSPLWDRGPSTPHSVAQAPLLSEPHHFCQCRVSSTSTLTNRSCCHSSVGREFTGSPVVLPCPRKPSHCCCSSRSNKGSSG